MHTMLTNLCCLKQDTLLCAYSNISPHVAHCNMVIASLSSVIEFIHTILTEIYSRNPLASWTTSATPQSSAIPITVKFYTHTQHFYLTSFTQLSLQRCFHTCRHHLIDFSHAFIHHSHTTGHIETPFRLFEQTSTRLCSRTIQKPTTTPHKFIVAYQSPRLSINSLNLVYAL